MSHLSGIIDWADTTFTDPAYDFGLLYRDLGPAVLEASLEGYTRVHSGEKRQIRRHAYFYGRCRVLENVGRMTGCDAGRDRVALSPER